MSKSIMEQELEAILSPEELAEVDNITTEIQEELNDNQQENDNDESLQQSEKPAEGQPKENEEEQETLDSKEEQQKVFDEAYDRVLKEAVAKGYNPEQYSKNHPEYTSPKDWVRFDDMLKTNQRQNEEHTQQIEAVKKLYEARADDRIREVTAAMQKAKDDYDFDAYDKHNTDLREAEAQKSQLNAQPVQPAGYTEPPEITEWNKNNPWIDDDSDPRSIDAKQYYGTYTKTYPNAPAINAIRYVEHKLGINQPEQTKTQQKAAYNPRRNIPTQNEKPKEGRVNKNEATWDDLSTEDKKGYTQWGDIWKNKAEYIKAITADKHRYRRV